MAAKKAPRQGAKSNRKAKDSVFADLFTIPEYQLQLFQKLHPEATGYTEKDIEVVTLEHVLMNGQYNDLGLLIGDYFLILAEAQSTWSVNILPRFLLYLAATYRDYIEKHNISLYGTAKAKLPRPELYVIYTGKRGQHGKELSLTEEFFDGQASSMEIKAKVIYGDRRSKDVISQYINFCRVLDEQVALHGRTQKAIKETIKICSDENILKEYLKNHRKEVVDIMTQLYDKEREMRLYVEREKKLYAEEECRKAMAKGEAKGEAKGKAEGKAEGKTDAIMESIHNLMKSMKWTAKQAMDALGLSAKEQKKYLAML